MLSSNDIEAIARMRTLAADSKEDLRCRDGWSSLLHPDLVVMERRTADRCDGLGTGEHVDAATADMGFVRMHRFRDQHAAAHAIEYSCGQRRLASDIAECNGITVHDRKRSGIG